MLKTANTRSQQRKNRTKNILTIIAVIVTILIVGGLITYMAIYNHNKALSAQNGDSNGTEINNPDVNTTYYNEVHYVGGIGYSKVYDYAFKPSYSDTYVSNKDLWSKVSEDTLNQIRDTATDYANTLFNVSYRTLQDNPDTYKDSLLKNMNSRTLYMTEYPQEESDYISTSVLVDEIISFYIDNEIQCEASFKTDTSLIYKDNGYTYVRGVLELTSYGAKEGSGFDFEKGIKTPIMITIKLYPNADTLTYQVVDVGKGLILNDADDEWWIEKTVLGDVVHRLITM